MNLDDGLVRAMLARRVARSDVPAGSMFAVYADRELTCLALTGLGGAELPHVDIADGRIGMLKATEAVYVR